MKQIGHVGCEVLRAGAPDGLARHQDRIVGVPPKSQLSPRGPQDPSCPIAFHRTPDAAADDEGDLARSGSEEHHHSLAVQRSSPLQELTDIGRSHRRSAMRGRQSRTAFPPARGKDGPAGTRTHPQPEAVAPSTPAVVRLIRPLALGHDRPLEPRREGRRAAGRRQVYGPTSSLAKGLDNRKCVKTATSASVAENRCAIVPPLPTVNRTEAGAPDTFPPRCCPPMWKGSVDCHGPSPL